MNTKIMDTMDTFSYFVEHCERADNLTMCVARHYFSIWNISLIII